MTFCELFLQCTEKQQQMDLERLQAAKMGRTMVDFTKATVVAASVVPPSHTGAGTLTKPIETVSTFGQHQKRSKWDQVEVEDGKSKREQIVQQIIAPAPVPAQVPSTSVASVTSATGFHASASAYADYM